MHDWVKVKVAGTPFPRVLTKKLAKSANKNLFADLASFFVSRGAKSAANKKAS